MISESPHTPPYTAPQRLLAEVFELVARSAARGDRQAQAWVRDELTPGHRWNVPYDLVCAFLRVPEDALRRGLVAGSIPVERPVTRGVSTSVEISDRGMQLREWASAGIRPTQMAAMLGVTRTRVYAMLRRAGVDWHRWQKPMEVVDGKEAESVGA